MKISLIILSLRTDRFESGGLPRVNVLGTFRGVPRIWASGNISPRGDEYQDDSRFDASRAS